MGSHRRSSNRRPRRCFKHDCKSHFLCISLIRVCIFSHSKSSNSISDTMKSETKEHNISPMLWKARIRYILFSTHLFHNHHFSFTQMLQKLDLGGNQIGDEGTQLLADALKQNKVKCIFLPHLHHCYLYFFAQKLTILNLSKNKIGDKGATHLANALKENEVNCILYSCVS